MFIDILYRGFLLVEWVLSGGLVFLGLLSAVSPGTMIKFHQWLMLKLNWKVVPVDEEREKRNTYVIGLIVALLGAFLAIVLLIAH